MNELHNIQMQKAGSLQLFFYLWLLPASDLARLGGSARLLSAYAVPLGKSLELGLSVVSFRILRVLEASPVF
jgi:hypothetical protein